ncbi:hypothetical protein [Hydrogenophaga sp.]|uniref:hypothetical protein n=1 Tax=Hydrogenophaga sp. TaxID=1904254 RepID=UPI002723A8AC|nr:hypothetical protein [Hydrogenophaga sp.]MDO9437980.1 hypothetical protein [Hydrogenophaga sp.]
MTNKTSPGLDSTTNTKDNPACTGDPQPGSNLSRDAVSPVRPLDLGQPAAIHGEVFDGFGQWQWHKNGTPGNLLLDEIDAPVLVGELGDKVAITSMACNGDQTLTHRILFKDGDVMTRILDSNGKELLTAQAGDELTACSVTGMYSVFDPLAQETSTYNAFTRAYSQHSTADVMGIPGADGSGGSLVRECELDGEELV